MKVEVDERLCRGCALCCEACPELFTWRENGRGVAHAMRGSVPADLQALCLSTAQDCPVDAIFVDDERPAARTAYSPADSVLSRPSSLAR